MKKIHVVLLVALGLAVSGCYTSHVSKNQVMNIHEGMSRQDVQNILGQPDYRRFEGSMEEWEFHRDKGTPVVRSEPITIIVRFINQKVTGMDSFDGMESGSHPVVVASPAVSGEMMPGREPVKEVYVMTDAEFDAFMRKLKFTVISDDQKKLIGDMLQKHDVTSAQCVEMVKTVSYTPNQVEVMKKLYPYVRDKQNFNKVIDVLFSNTYKEEMRKFVKEYHRREG